MACVTDEDCVVPKVCYRNVSWAPDRIFCDCDVFNGWVGPDCLELGSQAYFTLANIAIQAGIVFAGLGIGIRSIYLLGKSDKGWYLHLNTGNATLLICLLDILLGIAFGVIQVIKLLTPENFTKLETENFFDKRRQHQVQDAERSVIAAAAVVGLIAVLQLSLLWIEIAVDTKKMSARRKTAITRYRIVIYVAEAVFIVSCTVAWRYSSAIFVVLSLPLIVLVTATYLYGAFKLLPLLRKLNQLQGKGDKKYADLPIRIQRTTLVVLASLWYFVIVSGIYAYFSLVPENGVRDVCQVGSICVASAMINGLAAYGLIFCVLAIIVYIYLNVKQIAEANERRNQERRNPPEDMSYTLNTDDI